MTLEEKGPLNNLLNVDELSYGDKYKDHLFEQYKMYAESAEKVSDRRSSANRFFLSLSGVLVSVIGIMPQLKTNGMDFNLLWLIVVSFAGITFCLAWVTLIRSYRKLNNAKYTIITAMEQKFPAAPFDSEWKYLKMIKGAKEENNTKLGFKTRYFQLTGIEMWVPVVFLVLYGMIIIAVLFQSGVINLPSNVPTAIK